MSYKIFLAETFQKQLKSLKKKYPHIKEDLFTVIKSLEKDPSIGLSIPGWKGSVWKISVWGQTSN